MAVGEDGVYGVAHIPTVNGKESSVAWSYWSSALMEVVEQAVKRRSGGRALASSLQSLAQAEDICLRGHPRQLEHSKDSKRCSFSAKRDN